MDLNLKLVAESLITAIAHSDCMDVIDSTDLRPALEGEASASFAMAKYIDVPAADGKGTKPIGMLTYKVTIEATYEKYE